MKLTVQSGLSCLSGAAVRAVLASNPGPLDSRLVQCKLNSNLMTKYYVMTAFLIKIK